MIKDFFKLAWENITNRKLRSWLTILGIVIGIASVVALVSLGQGVKQVVTTQFEALGTDKIIISPAGSVGGSISYQGSAMLTEHDIDVIKRVKGTDVVGSFLIRTGAAEYKNDITYEAMFLGESMDATQAMVEKANNYEYSSGRPLKEGDKFKCVVGYSYAAGKLFKKEIVLGDKIKIAGKDFEVVGTLKTVGNPADDATILVPKDTLQEVYETEEESMILVQTAKGIDPEVVAEDIKKELRRSRNVKEGEEDFTVQTATQMIESFSVILDVVTGIIIGIAAISLFVGGIGIMNTMYTAVLERTNEIGIMKAVGARNSHILKLFLIESGLIGLIGGVLGISIGIGLSKIIEFVGKYFLGTPLLKSYFPWYLIVGSLAFAFIVGMISGTLPAKQAAEMNPVDALRYE